MCYSIHSFINKFDNLLVIVAGIDKKNFNKTVELTTEILTNMKKGKISEKEIQIAKEFYSSAAKEIEESEYRMMNEVFMQEILGIEPLEERVRKMRQVSKQEIVKTCKKINMDTVFLLEGVKNEEN